MRTARFCALFAALSVSLLFVSSALSFDKIPLWPSTPPGDKAEDYQENGGRYYAPYLEYWRPEKQTENACVIIACGGCYEGVAYEVEGVMPRDYFLEKGIPVFMLWYRTPRRPGVEKHMPAWQDAQRAIRTVRANAKDWDIDPNKIGFMGFSAGGHLCLMAATSSKTRAYEPVDELDEVPCNANFAIPVYPAYVLTDGVDEHNTNKGLDMELVPEFRFDDATPPMCFIHGDGDGWTSMGSLTVYRELKKMGVPAELHVYAYADHAFRNCGSEAPIRKYVQRVYEWLQTLEMIGAPESVKVQR